jgi:hypothetical protein
MPAPTHSAEGARLSRLPAAEARANPEWPQVGRSLNSFTPSDSLSRRDGESERGRMRCHRSPTWPVRSRRELPVRPRRARPSRPRPASPDPRRTQRPLRANDCRVRDRYPGDSPAAYASFSARQLWAPAAVVARPRRTIRKNGIATSSATTEKMTMAGSEKSYSTPMSALPTNQLNP